MSNKSGQSYSYTGSGTDSQGHWCTRDYGSAAPNQNSWHRSYNDGSYAYSNPNGSFFQKSATGESSYHAPNGAAYSKPDGAPSYTPAQGGNSGKK